MTVFGTRQTPLPASGQSPKSMLNQVCETRFIFPFLTVMQSEVLHGLLNACALKIYLETLVEICNKYNRYLSRYVCLKNVFSYIPTRVKDYDLLLCNGSAWMSLVSSQRLERGQQWLLAKTLKWTHVLDTWLKNLSVLGSLDLDNRRRNSKAGGHLEASGLNQLGHWKGFEYLFVGLVFTLKSFEGKVHPERIARAGQ